MSTAQLEKALAAVDWNANVQKFLGNAQSVEVFDRACSRIAIWCSQLETIDAKNPALTFIRALQISAQHIVATCSLGLYRAASVSIRSLVENGLYYTYFRHHPAELATLARDRGYFISKSDVVNYHKVHTPKFRELQETLGFLSALDEWYSEISAIVHGQIPGEWIENSSLSEINYSGNTLAAVGRSFLTAEELVHRLFLMTVGKEKWDSFAPQAKTMLLAEMPGKIRAALGLDKH